MVLLVVKTFMMLVMTAFFDFATDMFSIGIFASAETDGGFEYAFAFTGVENLTLKAIMADWDTYEITTFWGELPVWQSLGWC